MKSILLYAILVIFDNLLLSQNDYYIPEIPGSPRKAEIIEISNMEYLPVYYCKIGPDVYLGTSSIIDMKINVTWSKGYVDYRDSLRLVDYFDNYQFDNKELFGDEREVLNPTSAFYYKLKKRCRKQKHRYRILKRKEIFHDWWRDDFQR